MDIRRLLRHLIHTDWMTRRAFPPVVLDVIARAVAASEAGHAGELRFVVEGALHPTSFCRDQSARARALELFAQLGVWDTEANSGVLIYVLLADRDVEIVADRGIAARVPKTEWEALCRAMEAHFARGEFEAGALAGLAGADALLRAHFPRAADDRNELGDVPTLM